MARAALPSVPLSGLQLAVLLVAVGFLGVPAAEWLAGRLALGREATASLSQLLSFSVEAAALLAVPALRRRTVALLAAALPRERYVEILAVIVIAALGQFALFGFEAGSRWLHGGDEAVMAMSLAPTRAGDAAFAAARLRDLAISCLAAPLLEEILYRGFLFEAWAARRGIRAAMLLSSAVFALAHPNWLHPFFGGLLLCAVYLRTGALRAAIVVHCGANALNWYPLLGQFLIPRVNDGIASWWFQLACLALVPACVLLYSGLAVRTGDNAPGAAPTSIAAPT